MYNKNFLIEKADLYGIKISDLQAERFALFYEDLIDKNRVMNLTTITDWEDVVVKHYIDSLAIVKIFQKQLEKNLYVIDIGTGAGFPGIPLAIMYPNLKIVMVDSVGKKVTFLQCEIEKLGLSGVTAIHGRAEDLARQPQYREQFDLCVSRAVANLSTLTEYCLPFVKIGGSFIAYKAGNCQKELEDAARAITLLSGKLKHVENYVIDCSGETDKNKSETVFERTLIEIKKDTKSSDKYPRKAGMPSKNPL